MGRPPGSLNKSTLNRRLAEDRAVNGSSNAIKRGFNVILRLMDDESKSLEDREKIFRPYAMRFFDVQERRYEAELAAAQASGASSTPAVQVIQNNSELPIAKMTPTNIAGQLIEHVDD